QDLTDGVDSAWRNLSESVEQASSDSPPGTSMEREPEEDRGGDQMGGCKNLLVVLNPVAGTTTPDLVRQSLEHYLEGKATYERYETTGHDQEKVGEVVRAACQRGVDLVIAAGGDGTVSAVADGLVQTNVPLGILPIGTANLLAQELGIPQDLDAACQLAVEAPATRSIDAMQVGDRCFILNIGTGLDSLLISGTRREQKRRFGLLAYVWNGIASLVGYQPRRFSIQADDQHRRVHAAEVILTNGGFLGLPILRWGPDIHPDDGVITICIASARTLLDYLNIAWHMLRGQHRRSRHMRYLYARRTISVYADTPLPVHADGEIIGTTPVQVRVVPRAVRVVVPAGRGNHRPG
ncbi:MAG: diacylglycerol kinase family lipid kinase, partial [Chloroflexaceae bacterium]|nr:diacylglycerol kinase family lipid kinase [Chloroflexaceae bacterium]